MATTHRLRIHRNQAMTARLILTDGHIHGHHHVRPHHDRDRGPPRDSRVIGSLALLLDARDWSSLERLFADTVHYDRTSLFGGEPETLSPAELVEGYRQALGNLDALHHLITGHVINLDGDSATCSANMQGTHVLANASGGPDLDGRRPPRLPAPADRGRLEDRRTDIHHPVGDRQHAHHHPRGRGMMREIQRCSTRSI